MTKITTLLFDLDGTLLDTNELIIQSFLHVFEKYYPGKYKREDVLPFMGPTLIDTFGEMNPEKMDEMIEMYRDFNIAKHDSMVVAFEGVEETLKILKEEGFKLAIVTSKLKKVAKMGTELTNIDEFFDVFVGHDDVQVHKPNPEALFLAMEKLGSKPEETMMIGDNYHDINAAKAAGTVSVGVAWTVRGREYIESYHPDYVIDSIQDLLEILKV
ncbi:MAG: pyrophosphatase [Bacillales bacterium]|nr:pyrophosphatase [Bacillales bacterium]